MKELIEKLKALFSKKDSEPTDDELQAILDEAAKNGTVLKDVEIEQLKAALKSKGKTTDEPNAEIEALKTANLALTKQIDDLKELLTEMKKDRDAGKAAQEEQLKKETEKKKEELIKKGLKEGKIVEAKKEFAEKLFDKLGAEDFEAWLKDAPVHPEFKPDDDDKAGGGKNEKKTIRGPFDAAPKSMVDAMSKMDE